MSKSMEMIFIEKCDNFFAEYKTYPEKVIMNNNDKQKIIDGVNMLNRIFQKDEIIELDNYYNVRIEVDSNLPDNSWILVEPDFN